MLLISTSSTMTININSIMAAVLASSLMISGTCASGGIWTCIAKHDRTGYFQVTQKQPSNVDYSPIPGYLTYNCKTCGYFNWNGVITTGCAGYADSGSIPIDAPEDYPCSSDPYNLIKCDEYKGLTCVQSGATQISNKDSLTSSYMGVCSFTKTSYVNGRCFYPSNTDTVLLGQKQFVLTAYEAASITKDKCQALCKQNDSSYKYSAMFNGTQCFCGTGMNPNAKNGGNCNVPCPGHTDVFCGGTTNQMSVNHI